MDWSLPATNFMSRLPSRMSFVTVAQSLNNRSYSFLTLLMACSFYKVLYRPLLTGVSGNCRISCKVTLAYLCDYIIFNYKCQVRRLLNDFRTYIKNQISCGIENTESGLLPTLKCQR